jgi:tetratricopeptide (TPR) repeat protein/energy-coupling factor transporter ATP-binding protein EcfA2
VTTDRRPYPGLRPFTRTESDLFFGRDGCIADMVARLEKTRFLAVLGSSGTGKSSLVKCGLLAHLEDDEATTSWRFVEFRPGGDAFGRLAETLLKSGRAGDQHTPPPQAEIDRLKRRFAQEGPRELIRWCSEGHLAEGTSLLLVVDQFEELFRFQTSDQRDAAQAFVSLLLESRWPRGVASPQEARFPIFVTITMRSEYLGACALMPGLAEAINEGTYLTPRMTREQCEEAIAGPALVCDVEIDEQLINKLLNDMADFAPFEERRDDKDQANRLARQADQLPLMQYALNQMWRRASRVEQTEENPRPTKKIQLKFGDYLGLETELDQNGDRVFNELSKDEGAAAEIIFRAVTSGTTAANATRRPTRYVDLVKICGEGSGEAVAAAIRKFGSEDCQFLTTDSGDIQAGFSDDTWIDITHESLIRQWQRLSRWLEDEGRAAQEWRRLKETVERGDSLSWRGFLEARRLRVAGPQTRSKYRFFPIKMLEYSQSSYGKPTPAWAERYGDDFDRVSQLVNRSLLRHLIMAFVVVALAGSLVFQRYQSYKDKNAAINAKMAAITFAQKQLDYVIKDLYPSGDITTPGAKKVLQVAKSVIDDQVNTIDLLPGAISALVKLGCTAADLQGELGNYQDAYNAATEARNLVEKLQARDPNSPELPDLLYITTWHIGDAIAYQGTDSATQNRALAEYRKAEQLARQLLDKTPNDPKRREQLVFVLQKIGDVYEAEGELDTAMQQLQGALVLVRKTLADDPNNWDGRRIEANTIIRIGQILADNDKPDFDTVLSQYHSALDERTKLANEKPNSFVMQSNLVTSHRLIATLLARRGTADDFVSASSEYQQAMTIVRKLYDNDPNNATWQASLAQVEEGTADLLRKKDDLEDALKQDNEAYTLRKTLASRDPTNATRARSLGSVGIAIAGMLAKQAKHSSDAVARNQIFDQAINQYRNAIATLDEFKPRYDTMVFTSYIKIGDIFSTQTDLDNALKAYKTASGIALKFVPSNPSSVTWRKNLGTSYNKIADALLAQNNTREAVEEYRNALEIATALAERDPKQQEWRDSLQQKIAQLTQSP